MNKRGNIVLSILLGVLFASFLGYTTDEIIRNVYDASNTALRINVVTGGATGTVTGTGTAPDLAAWSSSSALTNYAGTGTSAGNVISALSATGAATFVPAGTTNITNVSGSVFIIPNKSSTGTTLNKLVKLDTTASPATAVIATTSDTTNILGVCVSGCGTTGNATILSVGQAPCIFSNASTVGHYVIVSTGTTGDCADSGSATTYPTGVAVLGVVAETGAAGTRQVDFNTPDVASASAGPNGKGSTVNINGAGIGNLANFNASTPAATGNFVNGTWAVSTSGNNSSVSVAVDPSTFAKLAYSSALNITGIAAVSSSASVAATTRIESCTSGASAITRTLPAATATGRVITLIKIDNGAGTCILGRAGSDTLNGATTKTLATQYTAEHCIDIASALWYCEGSGT
jgi:hypothetical protein